MIGQPPGICVRDADVAQYQEKGAGKNQFALFDAALQTVFNRQLELEFDLRSALDAGRSDSPTSRSTTSTTSPSSVSRHSFVGTTRRWG